MPSGAHCLATIPPAQNPSPLPCKMPPGSPDASPGILRSQTLPSHSRPVPSHDTLLHLNCVRIPPLNPPAILNPPTPPPFLQHPADVLPLLLFFAPYPPHPSTSAGPPLCILPSPADVLPFFFFSSPHISSAGRYTSGKIIIYVLSFLSI